jgi:hypothetical protein
MWASFDRFELQMTMAQAKSASHSGSCDADVETLTNTLARQLAKIEPATLAAELKGYGAWDDDDLQDHAANLRRIVWIAAGNIADKVAP